MMETMTLTLDDILRRCVRQSGNPSALRDVHRDGDYLYASDGHIGVEVPANAATDDYGPIDHYPNLESLLAPRDAEVAETYRTVDLRAPIDKWGMRPGT